MFVLDLFSYSCLELFADIIFLDPSKKPLRGSGRWSRRWHSWTGFRSQLGPRPYPQRLQPKDRTQRIHLPLFAHSLQH